MKCYVYVRNRDTDLLVLGSQLEVQNGSFEGLPHGRDMKSDIVEENCIAHFLALEK